MAEMHKAGVTKVKQLSSRMSRSLMSLESSLPGMKRKHGVPTYNRLREGLMACRDAYSSVMDELEDLKELKEMECDENEQAEKVTHLNKLARTLQEHSEALQEAFAKHQNEAPVKKDKDEKEQNDGEPASTGWWAS